MNFSVINFYSRFETMTKWQVFRTFEKWFIPSFSWNIKRFKLACYCRLWRPEQTKLDRELSWSKTLCLCLTTLSHLHIMCQLSVCGNWFKTDVWKEERTKWEKLTSRSALDKEAWWCSWNWRTGSGVDINKQPGDMWKKSELLFLSFSSSRLSNQKPIACLRSQFVRKYKFLLEPSNLIGPSSFPLILALLLRTNERTNE